MKLLSIAALTLLAADTFKARPDIDKVFATADGNIFHPDKLNLARNHARQEGLTVEEISRTGATSDDILDHIQTDAEANELKQQEEAAEAARLAATTVPPATGAAVPVEAAAAAQAAGKTDAVEATAKAQDAPAAEAPAAPASDATAPAAMAPKAKAAPEAGK